MKTNIAVLSFLICIVMVTTAVKAADFNDVNLPPNGNFQGGFYYGNWGHRMPNGWQWWDNLMGGYGNPTVSADYNDDGYVIVQMDCNNNSTGNPHGYATIWQTPTVNLTTLGIPETALPIDMFIAVDINDLIPGGGLPIAVISNKCLDNSENGTAGPNTLSNLQYSIVDTNAHVGWTTYRYDFPMPEGTKSIQPHFGIDYPAGPNTGPPSKFAFDNFRIGFLDGITPALCPIPIIGGAQNLPNKVISWTNPPRAVNADVYMMDLPSPADYGVNPRTEGTLIAHDTNAQSLTVSSLRVNRYYYWIVDVNMGSSVVGGFIWDFHTTNLNVVAGPTQYLVRTASPKTLILNATVTSDNAIATYAWTNITAAANKDPYTTVTIVSPTTEDTNVTLTNTEPNHTVDGWYQFTLTVTDVQGNIAADTVNVGVYATCAAAAIADPNDNYTGAGDLNGDCKVDLYDFAVIANNWLACDSLRRSCP
jgi:hypothetical protein